MRLTVRTTFALICTAAMVLLTIGLTTLDSLAAGQETKRVFVLNSYHKGFTFSDNEMRGIDVTFGKSDIIIESYVTYMDVKRIPPGSQYFSKLKELIKEGYKGVRFDAVLICDNDALEFMRKYRDELFPGVPVVFSGINDFNEWMLDKRRDITGTIESTDFAGTISSALKLRPATKNIVVVTDNTTTGKALRSEIEKIHPGFAQSLGFTYVSLGDMTLNELAQTLSKLNSDSIVLLLSHSVDKNGTSHTVKESASLLAKSSSVPTFVVNDSRMGLGVLGGHLVSGYSQGETAAQMALKILSGIDIRSIPVLLDSPNRYMFDYSVMQRFGITEGDLPQGSILINKPVSVLDKYRPHLFAILGAIIILCGCVAYLLIEISRRTQAQEELRESEEKYRAVADYTYDWESWVGRDGKLIWINPGVERLTGYSVEECYSMSDFPLPIIAETEREKVARNFADALKGAHVGEFDFRIHCKDGSMKWGTVSYQPIYNASGTNMGHRASIRDITERKQAEEELQESREQLQEAHRLAHIGVWRWDADTDTVTWTHELYRIIGLDPMLPALTFAEHSKIYTSESWGLLKKAVEQAMTTGEPYQLELEAIRSDGSTRWLHAFGGVIDDNNGRIKGLYGTVHDITERKRAGDKINALLAEKELLLREVHHRIKNNMTVINSLLTLQAGTLKDPSAITALNESGSRVRSMMTLYDKLYQSASFNTISALNYLPSLVDEIVANFPNTTLVKIEKKIDDFVLDAKRLQPLGIIINELLTNIMKYAFTGRDDGSITVWATRAGNRVSLVIEDNGNGMPESIDFENSPGFGLMLVGILTKQLEGSIRIEREHGTRIILEFEA